MVTEDRVAPKAVLQPEGRVEHRIVLLGGADVEPDASEAADRLQLRPGDVQVVVEKEPAAESREISEQRGRKKKRCQQQVPPAIRPQGCADSPKRWRHELKRNVGGLYLRKSLKRPPKAAPDSAAGISVDQRHPTGDTYCS